MQGKYQPIRAPCLEKHAMYLQQDRPHVSPAAPGPRSLGMIFSQLFNAGTPAGQVNTVSIAVPRCPGVQGNILLTLSSYLSSAVEPLKHPKA